MEKKYEQQSERDEEAQNGHFEMADPIGMSAAMAANPSEEDSPETAQRKAIQHAANQSDRVQQHLALQRKINASVSSGVVQRAVFKDSDETYKTSSGVYTSKKNEIEAGSSTKSISYTTDNGLPTPWKVLKDQFDEENLNKANVSVYEYDTIDRPRSVSAEITSQELGERDDPITQTVGHLGNDELYIREGADSSFYDGGHMIGAMILGAEAQEAYDLAPQERDQNQNAYNNTIENIARTQGHGSIFDFEVELGYEKNNFSIDQQTLKDRGILRELDDDKPWVVHIPARIPRTWSTSAKLKSGGNWRAIHNNTKDRSLESKGDVDSKVLTGETEEDKGAFHFTGDGTKELSFYSKQYVPTDTAEKDRPETSKKASSLANPNKYEDALPKKEEVLKELPALGNKLSKDGFAYRLKMTLHRGHSYLGGSDMRTTFPASRNMPVDQVQFFNDEVTRVMNLIHVRYASVRNTLNQIDCSRVYSAAWGEEKSIFDEGVRSVRIEMDPLSASISGILEELQAIHNFGNDNKSLVLLKVKGEEDLQERWKKAKKLERRLDLISSETAEDRMKKLELLGKRLNLVTHNMSEVQNSLNKLVWIQLKNEIKVTLSGLPKSQLTGYLATFMKKSKKRKRFGD